MKRIKKNLSYEISMDNISLCHGTDARIVEMTKEERQRYMDDCNLVIDAFLPNTGASPRVYFTT